MREMRSVTQSRFTFIGVSLLAIVLLHCGPKTQLTDTPLPLPETNGHQLEGKIYSVGEERFMSWVELMERAVAVDYLVVGEKHDNDRHHHYEMEILKSLSLRGELNFVVLEMLATDQNEALTASRELRGEALKAALKWERTGWDWQAYGQILELLLDGGIELRPGNLARSEVMERMRGGRSLEEVGRLSVPAQEMLLDILEEGHCQMVPRDRLGPMLNIQVARDLQMQRAMGAPGGKTIVLIAGRFHARRDLGVPLHLRTEYPAAKTASVGLVEATPDKLTVRDYEFAAAGSNQHDYLIFTKIAVREGDPCDELRRMYRHHSKPAASENE